jgi:hypothetical protein
MSTMADFITNTTPESVFLLKLHTRKLIPSQATLQVTVLIQDCGKSKDSERDFFFSKTL